jgi:hypothetical protein
LQGLQPSLPELSVVEVLLVSTVEHDNAKMAIPQQVQKLLQSFEELFEEPTDVPPSRPCNHTIPLVPGAQPISIKPYRFSPAMKDEVELQVQDMLRKGIIQPSQRAFSSPVLLVKKKDKTCHFCVDYMHLNALTVKSKYLVPIIDELHGACWFSSLDLRAGFHQILLEPVEEYKTAFQTHLWHFEF